jgi:hypothetical protein
MTEMCRMILYSEVKLPSVLPLRHCIEQLLGRAGDERPFRLRRIAPPLEGAPPPAVTAKSTSSVELASATAAARGRNRERGGAPPPVVAAASTVSVELAPAPPPRAGASAGQLPAPGHLCRERRLGGACPIPVLPPRAQA